METAKDMIRKIGMAVAIAIWLTGLLSCSKEENIGQRPDERLTEALNQYGTQLTSAPYGWKAHLFPSGGGGYGFWFVFDANNRVGMLADISTETGDVLAESSYRLKATLLPSLYFDTYSYIHWLADPDASVNGGTSGWGLYSDFEFSILEASADTITLRGNLNDSRLQLIRANEEESQAYQQGQLNVLRTRLSEAFGDSPFYYLEDAAGAVYGLDLNMDRKTLSFTYEDGGAVQTTTLGFALSGTNEAVLSDVFRAGRMEVDRFRIQQTQGTSYAEAVYGNRVFELWPTDQPLFPFTQLWGQSYETIRVPMEETAVGNGTEFETRRLNFLENARPLLTSGTTFPEMRLSLDRAQRLLFVNQIIRQGTTDFNANFVFSYTEDNGVFLLQWEGTADSNADYIFNAYVSLLEGFLQGNMQFGYDLQTSNLRAYGQSSGLTGFRFVGAIN